MGADSFHHPSQLRPHKSAPLPETIPEDVIPPTVNTSGTTGGLCPGSIFETIHPATKRRSQHIPSHYKTQISTYHTGPRTTPFFTISQKPNGETVAVDIEQARATIRRLQAFDGNENVLVIAAHDITLAPVIELFPARANEWKRKGWKEKGRWRFLKDLLPAVEAAKQQA